MRALSITTILFTQSVGVRTCSTLVRKECSLAAYGSALITLNFWEQEVSMHYAHAISPVSYNTVLTNEGKCNAKR